ncbi:MAG: methionine synthase [Ruminococcus sp.]|nr:methionine synthase [Ruminococcus sp.]
MIKLTRIDRAEAFRYMGMNENAPENIAELADECEKRLTEAAAPKFRSVFEEIANITENSVTLSESGLVLEGADIASHLKNCFGAVLLCATLGNEADRLIRTLQIEDMAKAMIADAFCGAAIEQVCDKAEAVIKEDFPGKYFTFRFSPGYGDFPIEIQKKLLNVLDARRKIGLCATDSFMLAPIKSVTAVIGVSHTPLPPEKRGCAVCNMRESCNFRKRGSHCGL